MWKTITDFLFNRPVGRFILIGLIVVLAAYVARLYFVDAPKRDARDDRGSGLERLETMADALEKAASEAKDSDEFLSQLPERTEWYPATLPCAASVSLPAKRPKVWGVLGLEAGEETSFQFRFERDEEGFVLRARRDSDCDGLHAVHTLRGRTDWTSAVAGRRLRSENVSE